MSEEKNAVLTEESYIEKTDSTAGFNKIMKAVSDHQQGIKKEVWPTGFYELDDACVHNDRRRDDAGKSDDANGNVDQ